VGGTAGAGSVAARSESGHINRRRDRAEPGPERRLSVGRAGRGGAERRMHCRVGRAMECQRHGGAGQDCAPVREGSETPVARRLPSGVRATNGGLDDKTALMAAVGVLGPTAHPGCPSRCFLE
jgi:hypothetical protein